jgi:hypothetical protein
MNAEENHMDDMMPGYFGKRTRKFLNTPSFIDFFIMIRSRSQMAANCKMYGTGNTYL